MSSDATRIGGHVAVMGAGVIGAGWAALFVAAGHDVVAFDPDPAAEQRLASAIGAAWPTLQEIGRATGPVPWGRIAFTTEPERAAAGASFVQESGPEQLDLKRELMALLDRVTPASTVIASSSSGYRPSDLQAMCTDHPERLVVGHPFHPAHLVPLVEVVRGEATTDEVMDTAVAFYESVGKRPIRVNQELPGHVANRLQAAVWREAYSLVERGVVTVADLDAAITDGPGIRWAAVGPILGQHLSGGPGGLAHTLEHLGPPAQVWMDDLAATQLTAELASTLVAGVEAEIADRDTTQIAAGRDDLLVEILRRRRSAS